MENAAISDIIAVWLAKSCAIVFAISGAIVVAIPNVLPGSVTVGAANVMVVPSIVGGSQTPPNSHFFNIIILYRLTELQLGVLEYGNRSSATRRFP